MRHRPAALFTFLLLAGLVAVPVGLTWRQVRQERLNHILIDAVRRRNASVAYAMLEQGADVNARILYPMRVVRRLPARESHPLWTDLWERLRPKPRPKYLGDPLIIYATRGDVRSHLMVEILLNAGADANTRSEFGETPMMTAALGTDEQTLALLLRYGANINAYSPGGVTALHRATLNRNIRTIKFLLDHGATINAQDDRGDTALIIASEHGDENAVRLLLSRHASACLHNKAGETALNVAIALNIYGWDLPQTQKDLIIRLLKQAGGK